MPKRHKQLDNQIDSAGRIVGSKSRVVTDNNQIVEVDEDGQHCTVNLVFCPRCARNSNNKDQIPVAGFRWVVKPENIYDGISFIRLQYECGKCHVLTDIPQDQLNKLNKISCQDIEKCRFPPGTKGAIRNQVRGLVFP